MTMKEMILFFLIESPGLEIHITSKKELIYFGCPLKSPKDSGTVVIRISFGLGI